MRITPFKLFLNIALVLLLSACAGQLQIMDLEEPSPDKSIVFGRLDLVKDGKPQPWSSFWKLREGRILILAPGSSKAIKYTAGSDGSFYWGLEPGDYTILAFELSEGSTVRGGRIGATFTVSEETKSIYIGNLKILLEKGVYGFAIEDDYSAAVESFKNRFPKSREPVKILALPEEKLGSYQRVRYVCANEWGINCTKKHIKGVGFIRYDGVTPLSPEVSASAVPAIDSLLPTFEWNPSSRDDVSYDLVVYEAASYTRTGVYTEYMPGRLVEYKQDIKETRFRLKDPLQPNIKYYWSVRLRRNDIVSTWSKFSYFQTIIIYTGSGRSQWFTFATPSE